MKKSQCKSDACNLVKKILRGKVTTYGDIATKLGKPNWARQVGWLLHQNIDIKTPCHRVVNRYGRPAPNIVFDCAIEQRRRLLEGKVSFTDDMHVNMEKSIFD